MYSFFHSAVGLAALIVATAMPAQAQQQMKTLCVCADPNNLPFSNALEQGFENRIMLLVATELGADIHYTWWAQRRGFIRNGLNVGLCEVVAGVPVDYELTLTTRPYHRSSYVMVSRPDLHLASLALTAAIVLAACEQELWAIVAFLKVMPTLSPAEYRSQRARLVTADAEHASERTPEDSEPPRATGGDSERGRVAIRQYGCRTCHLIPGVTGADSLVGPPRHPSGGSAIAGMGFC